MAPDDRLLFLTDGMLDRNAASFDVPALVAASEHRHPQLPPGGAILATWATSAGDPVGRLSESRSAVYGHMAGP